MIATEARLAAEAFRALPLEERRRRLEALSPDELIALKYDWDFWARDKQLLPGPKSNPRVDDGAWQIWLVDAGRGFGKTRVGAETVRIWARDFSIVNLIGATVDDARDIMIEGESGILACCPKDERPQYKKSERKLVWPNGATSLIFTADEPERLRGKQHEKAWADEVAAWRYREAWDQLLLGLRLGSCPQVVVTTTPKPSALIRELIADPTAYVTRGTTYDNRDNLAPTFYSRIIKRYEGTRLGRQELNAELLDDNPNALWNHKLIDAYRVSEIPPLQRIVIGVDPAVTANEDSDATGIVVAGVATLPPNHPLMVPGSGMVPNPVHYFVLDDATCSVSPNAWAQLVSNLYRYHKADRVVAEVNNGGDLVETVLRNVDPNIPFSAVHATRGKTLRAEPIAALYEQGRVHHVGCFGALEDQMCDFDPKMEDQKSPDRMDALVWALTELSAEAAPVFELRGIR